MLRWILNFTDATERIEQWQHLLSEFEFNFVHHAGVKHQAADALSRLPIDGTYNTRLKDEPLALVIASGEKMHDTRTPIFSFEAHTSTPMQSVTDTDVTNATSPILAEFITAHSADEFCQNFARRLDQAGTEFTLEKEGVLVRCTPIDGALQKPVPQSLRHCLLNLSHDPSISGHPGQRCMYDTMRKDYFRPNMASNVYRTVNNCYSCAKTSTTITHKRYLKLFPATRDR